MSMTPGSVSGTHGDHVRVLRVRAATFPRRLTAALVDVLVVVAVTVGLTCAAGLALGVPLPKAKELGPDLLVAGLLDRSPMAVGALGLLLGIGALYQIYFGGITGQTLGKRLVGVRVISNRGTPPGAARGMVRFVALLVSLLPVGLGWLWCLFDRERRALHDHLVGTYVIFDETGAPPARR
jgi:uncharacterized RDD family membrane protein YckC